MKSSISIVSAFLLVTASAYSAVAGPYGTYPASEAKILTLVQAKKKKSSGSCFADCMAKVEGEEST